MYTQPVLVKVLSSITYGLQPTHSCPCILALPVNRDLKASNILIDKNGVVKLADFGLARTYQSKQDSRLTNRVRAENSCVVALGTGWRGPGLLVKECLSLLTHLYHHSLSSCTCTATVTRGSPLRSLRCGTVPLSCCWVLTSMGLRLTCGVWAASLRSCSWASLSSRVSWFALDPVIQVAYGVLQSIGWLASDASNMEMLVRSKLLLALQQYSSCTYTAALPTTLCPQQPAWCFLQHSSPCLRTPHFPSTLPHMCMQVTTRRIRQTRSSR